MSPPQTIVSKIRHKSFPQLDTRQTASLILHQTKAAKLNRDVLEYALKAYNCARQEGRDAQQLLTLIDYSRPSTEKRLWVLDLAKKRIIYNELVAHGKNTGNNYSQHFSNRPGSRESSLGLFETRNTYYGHKGLSLRLVGLNKRYNGNALRRATVIHGASYVSAEFAKAHGRIGRSWGCPALSVKNAKSTINKIKQGSLIFAYYPDPHWLKQSPYLHC